MPEKCHLCQEAVEFHQGIRGKRADSTKILFIANKPDLRTSVDVLPGFDRYESALYNSHTGQEVSDMLKNSGLSWEDIYWTNVFKCSLVKNRYPTKEEYKICYQQVFIPQVAEFSPRKIVVFGKPAYDLMFPKKRGFREMWRRTSSYQGIPALILPHPQVIWAFMNPRNKKPYHDSLAEFLTQE